MPSSNDLRFTCAAIWLPCYQTSFFAPDQDDKILRDRYDLTSTPDPELLTAPHTFLDTSIYSRLLKVLPKKGYTEAYSIYNAQHTHDPGAILFVSHNAEGLDSLAGLAIEALTLLVNSQGFYVWTAAYDHGVVDEAAVQAGLKKHIVALVGEKFASHASGREVKGQPLETEAEQGPSLADYRDEPIGMLTFFQINTILEGLYNANLDFRVFFGSDESVIKEYTLGAFTQGIIATFTPTIGAPTRRGKRAKHALLSTNEASALDGAAGSVHEASEPSLMDQFARFFTDILADTSRLDDKAFDKELNHYVSLCLKDAFITHILEDFLHATSYVTLKSLKKRIERCRRGLLDELIEVTHRRTPLIQTEAPDDLRDRVEGITEAQLRGYVMLFAAKMPLIANVKLHLEDLHDLHTLKREEREAYESWTTLLDALVSDVEGLTEAIEQARTDHMLYEEQQIHAEQETLAEIQRLRERDESAVSSTENMTINLVSTLLALVAVVSALGPIFHNGVPSITLPDFSHLLRLQNLAALGTLILFALLIIFVFVALLVVGRLLLHVYVRHAHRNAQADEKFYYEMDIRVDAPFKSSTLKPLFETGRPLQASPEDESRQHGFAPIKDVHRQSYRVERTERSEAMHKIYVEARFLVGQYERGDGITPHYIRAILVYEVMFHRPSQEHGYILKDLRVVATHASILTVDEIRAFKEGVVDHFVNPCLSDPWQLVIRMKTPPDPGTDEKYDALMTLNVTEDHAPALTLAAADSAAWVESPALAATPLPGAQL